MTNFEKLLEDIQEMNAEEIVSFVIKTKYEVGIKEFQIWLDSEVKNNA